MIRMMLTMALASAVLGALLLQTAAAGDDETPLTEKLIEQLGSSDFAERERVAQMLKDRGPSVLPALRKALKHSNEEVRRRAQELIAPLETAVALAPKRITLDREKRQLPAILQEIEKQTGFKVAADDGGDNTFYRIEMKQVPFWEALERVGRETGRVVKVAQAEDPCQLLRRDGSAPLVVVEGAFRLEITRIHEDRDIDFTEKAEDKKPGRRNHRLTLTVAVAAEPRFTLLNIGKPRVEAALDENEKPLRSPPAPDERELDHLRMRPDMFRPVFQPLTTLVLQRSNEKAKTIKMLRGTIPVKLVVEHKPVVVTKKVLESKGTKFEIAGDTLEITDAVQLKAGHYYVSIAVPPELDERQAHWFERVQLEDVNGMRYEARSLRTSTGGNKKEINFMYDQSTNPKLGPPCRLVIEDWVVLHYAIPFEFKDVPLP